MSITYAKTVGLIKMPPTVTIGDRVYTLVKLGDYEIMIDNVTDYGVLNTHYVKKADIGVCYYYASVINSLFATQLNDGFTFITNAILQNIFDSLTGTPQEKTKKMLGNFDSTWNGTNETGLNLMPYGYKDYYGWQEYGQQCVLPRNDSYSQYEKAYLTSGVLTFGTQGNWSSSKACPVRLARHV